LAHFGKFDHISGHLCSSSTSGHLLAHLGTFQSFWAY